MSGAADERASVQVYGTEGGEVAYAGCRSESASAAVPGSSKREDATL